MSEMVEDAVASSCGDIVGHFWLIRVGPPTTSSVTPAGVTRITPGNSGLSNSVFAVIVLPTLTLCCLHL